MVPALVVAATKAMTIDINEEEEDARGRDEDDNDYIVL